MTPRRPQPVPSVRNPSLARPSPRRQITNCLLHAGILIAFLTAMGATPAAAQDVLTFHNDNARTGQDLNETILTPSQVSVSTFGKLFMIPVDGKVDAQPLYKSAVGIPNHAVHNVLFVATEHDSAYAFDADSGSLLWQVSLVNTGETPSDDRGCDQVTPEIGITATPVIDPNTGPHGTIYLVAMSKDNSGNYHQRLHALDITTGAEEFGGPITVQATVPGTGTEGSNGQQVFAPGQHKERAGLLLLNGVVYTAWSSHCDDTPYTGWIIGYDERTLAPVSVLNLAPNGSEASIWMSGAGPAADASGNIFLLAANGTFDTTLDANGFPSRGDYGNAFLKISSAHSALAVADYFTMSNTVAESAADEDFGSGGALLLPDLKDTQGKVHHLAAGAGKDQIIYVVDRDNVGKFNPGGDQIYQELNGVLGGSVYAMPAWFNNTLYYGAVGSPIIALPVSDAQVASTPSSQTPGSFGYPGSTPSISAQGTTAGIVWAAENNNVAVLHAYDATNLANELYNSGLAAGGRDQFGAGNKFIVPTIANGKVYVGSTSGVGVFGLLASQVALSPSSLNFSGEIIGNSSNAQAVRLANSSPNATTITSINASGDFSETNNCGASLAAGANCAIQVSFKPTAGGSRSGTLTVADSAPGSPQAISLTGAGQDFSIQAAANSSTSATVAAGQTATYTLSLSPQGGFNQPISVSCSGAPAESVCAVSPASPTLSGNAPTSVTVTVSTTASSAIPPLPGPLNSPPWSRLALGALILLLILVRKSVFAASTRRGPKAIAGSLGLLLLMIAVGLAAAFATSCGGSSGATSGNPANSNPGTPVGSYSLTVTARYSSGTIPVQHTLGLILKVD
ncbi:MAG: choice-of-anchor D domain-containing protein [Terriglobia bacterium]